MIQRTRGSALLEFTIVAIPVIFVLVSIFELSRGMWAYNSMAHGVKEATRYAVVHGTNCLNPPNNCTVRLSQVCRILEYHAAGLPRTDVVNLRFTRGGTTFTYTDLASCIAAGGGAPVFPAGASPTDTTGKPGTLVQVQAAYRFNSALVFYWTGRRSFTFGRFDLGATSQERVQY